MTVEDRRPIVGFGTNAWDPYWQTRQHILSGIAARGSAVVYSVGALHVWDVFGGRWSGARWRDGDAMIDGVHVYCPGRWQLRWPRFQRWDRYLVRYHAARMQELAAAVSSRAPIAYLFHPGFLPYLDAFESCSVVYHADDNFGLMPGTTPETLRLQSMLVERADLVIASSPRMAAALPKIKPVHVLPNGADAEAFSEARGCPCPADLAQIPTPRIGYVGFLNDKVNYALVAAIARARPHWHWVLVGPKVHPKNLSAVSREALARCEAAPNVHCLGGRRYVDLPRYVQHMDVTTMCYRTTPGGWWTDIYPLKLHEYLAAGKPTVGADIDAIRTFDEVVAVADSVEQWIDAIECALDGGGVGNSAQRLEVARENSWDRRLDRLEGWLDALG